MGVGTAPPRRLAICYSTMHRHCRAWMAMMRKQVANALAERRVCLITNQKSLKLTPPPSPPALPPPHPPPPPPHAEWTYGASSSSGVATRSSATSSSSPDGADVATSPVSPSWAETLAAATHSLQQQQQKTPSFKPREVPTLAERDDAFVRSMVELAWQATSAGAHAGGNDAAGQYNEGVRRQRAAESQQEAGSAEGAAADGAKALKAFEAAAGAGHTKAMVNAAVMYLHGAPGVEPNRHRALELVEAAAREGDVHASAFLGSQLLRGSRRKQADLPVTPDPERGRRLLLHASELGDKDASRILARAQ
jgi:TPR repeat protein